ncbi:MAG: MFS transporter [Ottowia sp.]
MPDSAQHAPALQRGRWYFGWNIVAVATVLVLLSIGLRLAVGPFFLPIVDDLGLSRSLFSSIVALALLVYGLVMPGVGWLVGRVGTRRVLLLGTALILAGGLWAATAHGTLTFTLAFSVVLSLGLALVSPVTLTKIVSTWFVRQRGMALFFLSTGGMAGLAVVTPALTWAVDLWGWRWALGGYVLLLALIAVPGTLLVMDDQPPDEADGSAARTTPLPRRAVQPRYGLWSALASRPFWLITIGLLANGYSMTLLGTHGIPMLVDHGFSAQTAAYGIGLIGLVAIAGTLVLGRMADRFPRRYILAAIYFVRGAAFVALMLVATRQGLYGVAFVGGLVWAGSMAVSSAIMADIYGVRLISVLYGVAFLCQQLAGMLAAWLGGWGFEVFGTHWISFGGSVAILLVGGATALMLPDARAQLAAAAAAARPPV